MLFRALAADYDGTIAHHGAVSDRTSEALEQFKRTGRRLLLVTGRDLPSLQQAFRRTTLFDRIVAENGGLLYDPATRIERALAPPPSPILVDHLRHRNVTPLSIGRTIVATWEPNEKIVLEAIRQLELDLQIIFNKGAVMVLPPGVTKATGLAAAIADLELSPINVVGVGDAENDQAFLKACGCSACVANALPMLKSDVDIVLHGDHGEGVIELMSRICHEDAALLRPERRGLLMGEQRAGRPLFIERITDEH